MTFSPSRVQSFFTAVASFQDFEPLFGDEVLISKGHCRTCFKKAKNILRYHEEDIAGTADLKFG